MDYDAPDSEHKDVAEYVANDHVFGQVGNVWIVGKPNLVTYRGPTMLATTLHAMAMLLRTCHWDWFINLSASDYPLVTQDDLIQVFSEVPRDINFIQHSSHLGWKL
ncbi:xylosyltransferase 1-like protein, partial [Trifolium pratense]